MDWICRLGDEQLKVMGPVLLNGLKKMLNHQELETARMHFVFLFCSYPDVATLKSMTYKCVGLLGKRLPGLFAKNFDLLKSFFETIANEKDQNIRQSLQGASHFLISSSLIARWTGKPYWSLCRQRCGHERKDPAAPIRTGQ